MKKRNIFNIIFILLLAGIVSMAFLACDDEPFNNDEDEYEKYLKEQKEFIEFFIGTWKNPTDRIIEITEKEIKESATNQSFTWSIETTHAFWENDVDETKTEYPIGILYIGKITKTEGYSSLIIEIGASSTARYYLHTDKKSFSYWGSGDAEHIFVRVLD